MLYRNTKYSSDVRKMMIFHDNDDEVGKRRDVFSRWTIIIFLDAYCAFVSLFISALSRSLSFIYSVGSFSLHIPPSRPAFSPFIFPVSSILPYPIRSVRMLRMDAEEK